MASSVGFWQLQRLSDQQLLDSLGNVLRRQHTTLAELIAHLGEVEERRLHLRAAHSSMFEYCVRRLGMSEDEACRRIELARLARKFPALFDPGNLRPLCRAHNRLAAEQAYGRSHIERAIAARRARNASAPQSTSEPRSEPSGGPATPRKPPTAGRGRVSGEASDCAE